jgi:hypothetical protein
MKVYFAVHFLYRNRQEILMDLVYIVSVSIGSDEIEAIQELTYLKQLYNTGEFDAEELLERVNLTEKYVDDFLNYCK